MERIEQSLEMKRLLDFLEDLEVHKAALCIESRARVSGLHKAVNECIKLVSNENLKILLTNMFFDTKYFLNMLELIYQNDVCTSIHIYALYRNIKYIGLIGELCYITNRLHDVLLRDLNLNTLEELIREVMRLHLDLACRCIIKRDLMFRVSLGVLTDLLTHLTLLRECVLLSGVSSEECSKILQSLCWRLDVVHAYCRERERLNEVSNRSFEVR